MERKLAGVTPSATSGGMAATTKDSIGMRPRLVSLARCGFQVPTDDCGTIAHCRAFARHSPDQCQAGTYAADLLISARQHWNLLSVAGRPRIETASGDAMTSTEVAGQVGDVFRAVGCIRFQLTAAPSCPTERALQIGLVTLKEGNVMLRR